MSSAIAMWLGEHLSTLGLSEECEGHLLGRGASTTLIGQLGIKEWVPASTACPSEQFTKRYGSHGDRLDRMVAIPLIAPSGRLLGVEFRSRFEKRITEFLVPESRWNAVMINAPQAAEKMWAGGSIWIVEGLFDLCALHWVIPKGDAVIATIRAGLDKPTIGFLARFCTNRVYMVYDNDATGRKAIHGWVDEQTGKPRLGAIGLLQRVGVKALDFRYSGKDPGVVWDKGGLKRVREVFNR